MVINHEDGGNHNICSEFYSIEHFLLSATIANTADLDSLNCYDIIQNVCSNDNLESKIIDIDTKNINSIPAASMNYRHWEVV